MFARRNEAIDMLRGLTMLLMVFVNDLWTVSGVPHFLEHFDRLEDGMGVSDIVFPMFLFAMGMSVPYAIERRFSKGFSGESTLSHILSRTLALLLMGVFIVNTEAAFTSTLGFGENVYCLLMVAAFFLVWNTYKEGMKARKWLQGLGVSILAFLALTYRTPEGGYFSAMWWGILGLIGWAYCFTAVTYLLARKKPGRIAVIWLVLCIVNMLMTKMRSGTGLVSGPSLLSDFANALKIGSASNVIMATGGMLLTLAEIRFSTRKAMFRIGGAFALSAVLTAAAALTHRWWIISKLVGTLPWCLYVSSISVAVYAILRILEAYGRTAWFRPLKVSGTATLSVYMMPYLLYSIFSICGIHTFSYLGGILGLIKCLLFSLLCVGLTSLLVRAGIKLKI